MTRPVSRIVVLLLAIGAVARADELPPASAPAGDPRLEALERRQRELEARLAKDETLLAADEAAAQSHYGAAGGAGAGEGGFLLHAPDDSFVINFRGYIQADERFYLSTTPAAASTFLLRRVRPVVEGVVFKYFGFKIMPDFGGGTVVLDDAWAEFHPIPELSLTVGKMKPPVGLERLQSARYIAFVERGLPTNLVPNRDVGIQLSGQLARGAVQVALGFFDGVVDSGLTDGDNNDAKDIAGRVFFHPLRPLDNPWLWNLGVGFSASHGTQLGTTTAPNLPSYKSIAQLTFFSYLNDGTAAGTVIAAGDKTRLSPQGYWYGGPVGVLAEYVWTSQDVAKGTTKATLDFTAWQVAASVVIGGKPSFEGVKIDAPFDPKTGGLGALELKLRYSEQHNDENAFSQGFADPAKSAQTIHAASVGVNWHFNRSYKLEIDGEYAKFDGGGAPDRGSETSILSRVQVAF
jgi:phosphate-selective porin OprO/OprP